MLVVVPSDGLTMSDEEIKAFVWRTLGIREPGAMDQALRLAFMIGKATSFGLNFGDGGTIKRFDTLSNATKLELYGQAEAIITVLVRRMVSGPTGHQLLVPGLRCYVEGDAGLQELQCSDTAFRVGTVYAAHPYLATRFLPLARFHPMLVDEKRQEFMALTASLGAKSVRIRQHERGAVSAGTEAGVRVAGLGGVDANAGVKSASIHEFSAEMAFGSPPRQPPALPDRLVWFSQEPLWQAMADARIRHRATTFNVSFTYEHDFGIDARVAASIEGAGLTAGGNFVKNDSISQSYDVEFWPIV